MRPISETSLEAWRHERVPELRGLFERYVYGSRPRRPRLMMAGVVHDDPAAFGGAGRVREVLLTFAGPDLALRLLLVTPNGRGPAGCFAGVNFRGNHCLLTDEAISLPRWAPLPLAPRGDEAGTWPVAKIVARGYALASFSMGDVVADDPELALPRLTELGRGLDTRPGAVMAWAWGLSRAIDYLETVSGIDPRRIAVVGHSRNGKAATVAAAFDDRVAMLVASGAGCGGTAPFRLDPELARPGASGRPAAETLEAITTAFPHWFSPLLSSFAGAPERLPVDQHELLALCAPRPILISNGVDDLWANPRGQYDMLAAAEPVYRLFGVGGLGPGAYPQPGTLVDGRLGCFLRAGGHAMTEEDWDAWLEYADRWLQR